MSGMGGSSSSPPGAGWAGRYDAKLAGSLGFTAERNFDEIIKVYQEDELGQ
ncbi:MAG TPA: hypothetical protein VEV64_09610 [Rhizomicrobium sp.]|nr:hypothetical protein [Rhizomicrobium sp.]